MSRTILAALLALGTLGPIPAPACTGFCAKSKGLVLAGNNEDWGNPRTRIWFVPAEKGAHGRMFVGFDNGFPQGGMNEQGLFFDGFATPRLEVAPTPDREVYFGNVAAKALAECATVDEVVRLFDRHTRPDRAVFLFADRNGDAVAIEPEAAVRKKHWFFVQTNFYQSRTPPGTETCQRFKIATRMLEDSRGAISVGLFRRILAATHQEGNATTQYSNIYDLTAHTMYLYHFHNFENVVRIDLAAELRKGPHTVEIPSLFPLTYAAEAHARWYEKEGKK
jgi:penicillin V acylase-like amidase (Ntn superfamily)